VFISVEGSSGTRTVEVRESDRGAHAGQWYFQCSCPAGKFGWNPNGYSPCKHVRAVIEASGVRLADGHFRGDTTTLDSLKALARRSRLGRVPVAS